ncbi:MAG TPA: ribonuclease P protein component [Candidatus Saccharimonadales bacterium]|nr:ribonuclease P protein component [Candidatus Saccharimonadales bacterium]
MIHRTHRFHGYNSLRYVYQHGQIARADKLNVKYIVNSRRSKYRLAVVVSRKVSKSAVVRNRIRRRVYEFVRIREPQITRPYDIVVTAFDEKFANLSAPKLDKTLNDLFRDTGLFSNQPKAPHVIVNKKEN